MIRTVLSLFILGCLASAVSAADDMQAEKAFAYLIFGNHFEDTCAAMTKGATHCPPRYSDKRLDYQDAKAKQAYVFGNSPCIIQATTTIASTGQTYDAVFNLQNVEFVNLGRKWRDGDIAGFEFLLQGPKVIVSDGSDGNVLYMLHKYLADSSGNIDHDINTEVMAMRKALKAYQDRFCPNMG